MMFAGTLLNQTPATAIAVHIGLRQGDRVDLAVIGLRVADLIVVVVVCGHIPAVVIC